ncbi:MAG: hypothetical protein ACFB4I_17805 [Cyanophyceae cyanobacterium]
MQYRTTIASSLITSGIVTLLLKILPGNSLWWGIAFLAIGTAVLFIKKSDRVPAP